MTLPPPAAPAGSVEVEGVRLAPAATAMLASCRRAADRLGVGASQANRRLLVRLAESLRLVPPGS